MPKNLLYMPGVQEAPRSKRSRMDTILITTALLDEWKTPVCQAPLKVNAKVRAAAEDLKGNGGFITGVLTLGTLKGSTAVYYLLDGQHRCEGFRISGLQEAIADVRIVDFDTMAEMGQEWVDLNSSLVRKTPDDLLHALELSLPAIKFIKQHCDFVGYSNIRRGTSTAAMLSMSVAIKCWTASQTEGAAMSSAKPAREIAADMTKDDYEDLVNFLLIARQAWGNHMEYARLWGALNLTVCMWLFHRLVLNPRHVHTNVGGRRHDSMNREQFRKCLTSLSSSSLYLEWLVGRNLSERDRGPCLAKIKAIFANRYREDAGKTIRLPQPAWSTR